MSYLLDTCVISGLRTEIPDAVQHWFSSREEESFFLSVVTVAEIWDGIERLPKSRKKTLLEDWFVGDVISRFKTRIIPIDYKIGMEWGTLNASLKKKGIILGTQDLYIGATAKAHGLSIVTINTKDFNSMEIPLFNPWEL